MITYTVCSRIVVRLGRVSPLTEKKHHEGVTPWCGVTCFTCTPWGSAKHNAAELPSGVGHQLLLLNALRIIGAALNPIIQTKLQIFKFIAKIRNSL
jgi:hypothetical protein